MASVQTIGVDNPHLVLGLGRDALGDVIRHMVFHIADIGHRFTRMAGPHTEHECLRVHRGVEGKRTGDNASNANRGCRKFFQSEPPLKAVKS